MLERKKVYAHIQVGFTTAVVLLLMFTTSLFLLGSEEAIDILKPRIPLVFLRVLMGILIFSLLASWSISLLEKKGIDKSSWKYWGFLIVIILISVAVLSLVEANFEVHDHEEFKKNLPNRRAAITFLNSSICILVFMIYQIWTVLEDNQKLQLSLASSEKDKVALQLSTLQQKVNPHFLFNSLNVLSELIYEDIEKANEFIHQFSKIYRYVLETDDKPLVTVRQELDFFYNYLYLQKIRFGEKLMVKVNLNSGFDNKLIPPLSLQLLLENAIKHNSATTNAPLIVELYNDSDSIIIKNNFNPRYQEEYSAGLGQKNLKSTYHLLTKKTPEFWIEQEVYFAKIPVINKAE